MPNQKPNPLFNEVLVELEQIISQLEEIEQEDSITSDREVTTKQPLSQAFTEGLAEIKPDSF